MTTAPAQRVVGSASEWVLDQVARPRRVAKVLHAGRDAVYVDLDGTCVGVLAARAVLVPCGVRTMLAALPEVGPGDEAVVGDGSVELPGCEVQVADLVDTKVPVITRASAAWGSDVLTGLTATRRRATCTSLPPRALDLLLAGHPGAVRALVGLGPGLTPLGDDVLCGWLAGAVARQHPALDDLRSTIAREAPRRTTTLSATLLGCASRGEGLPELIALLGGVGGQDLPEVERSADRLLRVGQTSGEGLLHGALLALQPRRGELR